MTILETKRLKIRAFEPKDAGLLYQYSNEEIAQKELPDEVLPSAQAAKEKIAFFHQQYESGNIRVYAIALKEIDLFIGHISLSPIDEGVEIGYSIATAFQRNGFSSEIVLPFSLWAKRTFAMDKLYGVVKPENFASVKSLEKAGYQLVEERERVCWGEPIRMRLYSL